MNDKLKAVIRHEFLTVIKQPSFWIMLIAIPVLIGIIGLASYLGNKSTEDALNKATAGDNKIVIIDNSKLVTPAVAKASGVQQATPADESKLIQQARDNKIKAVLVYPDNVAETGKYQAYINTDSTTFSNSKVTEVGDRVLQQSLLAPLGSAKLATLAIEGPDSEVTAFKAGGESKGFAAYIVPGIFLMLFYLITVFSFSYALTAVSDEKENRSIEMVLSYVKPQTLILGKLLGIVLVSIVQVAFLAVIGAITYGLLRVFGNEIGLPISVSEIVFDPQAILFGIGFVVLGYLLYVSLMATIGAIFPSSKEAGGFTSVFIIAAVSPFWLFSTISMQPDNIATKIMTYVPLTAPSTGLIRNTFGTLDVTSGLISLAILLITTIVILRLAGKAFRVGTLEFGSRVKLSSLFGNNK